MDTSTRLYAAGEKMKRILIMTSHPLYPIDHGAIIRVIEESKFLSADGFEVHLVGSRTNKEGMRRVAEMTNAEVHTYPMSLVRSGILLMLKKIDKSLSLKFSNPFSRWFSPSVRYDCAHIIKKVNPHIVQCEFIFLNYHTSKIAKKYGIPVVISEHNVEFVRLVKEGVVGAEREEEMKMLERDLCNSANSVTTVSEEDKQKLRAIGVLTPIEVIPNGVDYKRYQIREDVREETRRKYGIGRNDMVLVFHGTLNYRPNADANALLISHIFSELAKKYENLKLLLIGPGHPKEIGEKIIQLPAIPFDEFPEHLSMGDIGVVPLTAGSGTRLKIIEYLALGIPTVSTEIGAEGLPVTDGEDIIIAKNIKEDFVEKALNLLEDKELQERLRENGKKLVKEKLDWNIVLRKYLEIYGKLTGEKE
jgi:glycosyltransferase involved in cell wall biosynthesis